MTHRLSNMRVNRAGNPIADCSICGEGVKVLRNGMHKKGVCWRGYDEKQSTKRKAVRKRVMRPKKTVSAIRADESRRALSRTELVKLLSVELSRVCRERDDCTCFITGKRCEPGIGPGLGNAAHWLPRNDVPFWLRYDPRIVFWCEGVAHAEFDGRMSRFNRVAHQAFAWGKLAREKPDVFELLTGTDWKHQTRANVPIHELREKLEELRKL